MKSQVIDFFFSSRRRHTRCSRDWSSDVCSSDLDRPSGCWTGARDPWLAAFLAASAAWFAVDVLLLWGDRPYSTREMRLLFLAWNAVALASMPWMWHAASLAARSRISLVE